MAQQTIDLGAAPNDDTGDTLRDAGQKINDNFGELYAADADLDARVDSLESSASGSVVSTGTGTGGDFSIAVPSGENLLKLVLIVPGASSGGSGVHVGIRINGDTGANYDFQRATLYGTTSGSAQISTGATMLFTQRASADLNSAEQIIKLEIEQIGTGKAILSSKAVALADDNPQCSAMGYWDGAAGVSTINVLSAGGAAIPAGVEWRLLAI